MKTPNYLVKVRQENNTIYTVQAKNVQTSMGIYVPMIVWKACLVHGADVSYSTLRLTRVLEENAK